MKRLDIKAAALLTSYSLIYSFSIGFGNFSVGQSKTYQYDGFVKDYDLESGTDYVCFIDEDVESNRYRSIEAALAVAKADKNANQVYVYPGTNPEIKIDCEVAKEDSLLLPYEKDESTDAYTCLNNRGLVGTFADSSEASVTKFRKTNLKIKDKVKLINNGTITIGGQLGIGNDGSNQRPSGHTTGEYCQITLGTNAQIVNQGDGEINCYGYIKEAKKDNGSKVQLYDGTLHIPMVIYDYKGGSYTSTLNSNNVFPFTLFDFPNVQTELYSYHNGTINLMVGLKTGQSTINILDTFNLLSEVGSSLFKVVDQDGYMKLKYTSQNWNDDGTESYTVNDSALQTTSISVHGDAFFDALKGKMIVDIDSSAFYLPISYKYKINIESGTMVLMNDIKFMTGSSLVVSRDASLMVQKNAIFYQSFIDQSDVAKVYPSDLDPAYFLVNGSACFLGGLGGKVIADEDTASLTFGPEFTSDVKTNEMNAKSAISHEETAKGLLKKSGDTTASEQTFVGSSNCIASDKYWNETLYRYSVGFDINEYASPNAMMPIMTNDTSYVVSLPNMSRTYCDFEGWSYNDSIVLKNGEQKGIAELLGDKTYIKLVNQWSSKQPVKILYVIDPDSTKKVTGSKEETKTFLEDYTPDLSDFKKSDTSGGSLKWMMEGSTTEHESGSDPFTIDEKTVSGYGTDNLYITITVKWVENSCLLPTSQIIMADGSYKNAGDIRTGDMVVTFNHERGQFETFSVIVNDHIKEEASLRRIMNLEFDDGTSTGIIYEHGFFDYTLNRYAYITEDNYGQYLGHEFASVEGGISALSLGRKKLLAVTINEERTKVCSPVSANNLNIVSDNLLSMAAGIDGLFNFFEYEPNTLKYDPDKMKNDIETYGLLSYEDYKDLIPYELYQLLPCQYMSVSIGKGLITWDKIVEYIHRWLV